MTARLSALESTALSSFAALVRDLLGERATSLALFGSRARNEGRDDSDLDVLVLVRQMTRADRRAIQDAAFDVGLEHRLVLSPLVADVGEWRRELPLAMDIARDGISL